MMYPIVKQFHVILAITSISLFQFRYWFYKVPQRNPYQWMKILPHLIDTLLMTLGISLAVMASFSPFNSPWLLYKLMALFAYIIFGMYAMKRSGLQQWLNYVMASVAIVYMLFAATYKSPWF